MTRNLAQVCENVRVVGRDSLPDRLPGRGPLGGILTALEVSETDANLVVAVDLPMLTVPFLGYFRQRLETSTRLIVACEIDSLHPLCLGLRRGLLPVVQQRIDTGHSSIQGLIRDSAAELLTVTDLEHAGFTRLLFRNFNTPEDFEAHP
jgi:molybdopterin-guanine dinucleotide biosynthesis protein A